MLSANSFIIILKMKYSFRVNKAFLYTLSDTQKKISLKEFTKQFIQTNAVQNYEINKLSKKIISTNILNPIKGIKLLQ